MPGTQKILRFRREYNRWVANQTLEDYALRFTAKGARQWSAWRVANTAIGSISFLALEAIGGAITLNYGFTNAFWAILVVGLVIFITSLPVSFYAAKYGVDMDLLTRGAGFGYIGSTITSLIYASFTFIFFAIEAAIMALAFEMCAGIPLWIGYVISALLVIPLVTHGITLISKFQMWTQPLWLILMLLPFVVIAMRLPSAFTDWTSFTGRHGESAGSFNLMLFGAASAVVFSLVAQIGEQVDFLRFLPRPATQLSRTTWWVALISAGPGWILLGILKLLAGSFLLFLCLQHEVPIDKVAEPTQMYFVAFKYVFTSPEMALLVTGVFVVLSQLKINVTNAYAGSIAWSNFFARLTHSHPGRVVWLVFNVAIALMLMELGIFKALEATLGFYANVAIAWVGAIFADLVINKPLGLSPPGIEFKRAHLYDINPVGVGAMGIAALCSMMAYVGFWGSEAQALSPFIALGVSIALAPLIAYVTKGRYYLARQSRTDWQGRSMILCCVCRHKFEPEDMAHCPAYSGPICSLCCSLDVRCEDSCKKNAKLHEQLITFFNLFLPPRAVTMLDSRLGHYLGVFILSSLLLMSVFGLVYFQETLLNPAASEVIQPLLKVFFILFLIVGVVAWLFILAQESRKVAQEESTRQNALLMKEIDAHKKTDAALKHAKEVAEAANLAKSRYMSGISHELRTPLNAIMGYAQLLSQDDGIPSVHRDAISVIRRSGDHLSGLIDGLLDIAKIEAGKLMLSRDTIILRDYIDHLVRMFELQAHARGIGFSLEINGNLPEAVRTDEKRLRQILINLLSNAIKFTEKGKVLLRVTHQRQLTIFEIIDTGPGIAANELNNIFNPFERGQAAAGVAGTGLGLTIAKLLTHLMGGELTVESAVGRGSTFKVKLMFSVEANPPQTLPPQSRIVGYEGSRKTILVADDDEDHRRLMQDVLSPLGFTLVLASDGAQALELAQAVQPDLLLLDIAMPGRDGWSVARELRALGNERVPIVLVSANVFESQHRAADTTMIQDFLVKPVDLPQLLQLVRKHLNFNWLTETQHADLLPAGAAEISISRLAEDDVTELKALAQIGHVRAIRDKLAALRHSLPHAHLYLDELEDHVSHFRLKAFIQCLDATRQPEQ